jgi:hypothetical protein
VHCINKTKNWDEISHDVYFFGIPNKFGSAEDKIWPYIFSNFTPLNIMLSNRINSKKSNRGCFLQQKLILLQLANLLQETKLKQ